MVVVVFFTFSFMGSGFVNSGADTMETNTEIEEAISSVSVVSNCMLNNAIIYYKVSKASDIEIKIYDLDGRVVDVLVSGFKEAGSYATVWCYKNRTECSYFCQLTCDSKFMNCKQIALSE